MTEAVSRIHRVTCQVPPGQVASFGQIALVSAAPSSHLVGHVIADIACESDVPWHRVVNGNSTISIRRKGEGEIEQRQRLLAEGVEFNRRGRIDFSLVGWTGPNWQWLETEGLDVEHLILMSRRVSRRGPWVRWRL